VVLAFYEALKSRDVDTVHKILAHDLEWWFHGPPSHQFLMRLLTGEQKDNDVPFEFSPISITSFGDIVVVEGCDTSRSISWVHAWTVTDGVITQVREYFNTSLTVTRLGNQSQPSDFKSKSKSSSTTEISPVHCPSVWESSLSDRIGKSVPGLVLAI
jgi:ketosteroid isomerase-like protein